LPENERFVLSALSRFDDCFDLEIGIAVGSGGVMDVAETTACIANLVSKSLIERLEDGRSRFRLLDSIRYYASQKLISAVTIGISEVYGEHREGPSWNGCHSMRMDHSLQELMARAC
jgi:predicted ATPase